MKLRFFALFALVSGAALCNCRAQVMAPPRPIYAPQIEPKSDALWTSTREVRALAWSFANGGVWAATSGGVLGFDGHKWTKSTRRDGLPSHEALEVRELGHHPVVRFPNSTAYLENANWRVEMAPPWKKKPLSFTWNKQNVSVALDHLQIADTSFPLPGESSGTHISTVLNVGPTLLVAIYGDGLWNFDGQNWSRPAPVPPEAREITALSQNTGVLWIGTRRNGIFRRENGKWTACPQPDEPYSHNIQNLSEFGGVLWASTLDDGLVFRTGNGWKHVSMPILSSSAPRQMLVWQNRLYVRHGGGAVDSFDGQSWTKNALPTMPRKGVYALAGDEKTLFAAGWGGWSEFDGGKWTPHFEVPQLQGVPLMNLLSDGDLLWIGTQSHGLGRFNRKTNEFRWLDERDGLPDDWITALTKIDGKIYAGTFVGGLARLDGETWHVFDQLKGENVTALEAGEQGNVFAATRHGLWKIAGDEATKIEKPWLDSEAQALLKTKKGLWIGARTSLNYLTGT